LLELLCSPKRRRALPACVLAFALSCFALIGPVSALASTAPVIERETTTRLTSSDATLTTKVNPGGLETSYKFEMLRSCPEHANRATCELIQEIPLPGGTLPASAAGQHVSLNLNRAGVMLVASNAYEFSVSATNALGSARGPWRQFEAPSPGLPAIYSESASHITAHSATIAARINPEGEEVEYAIWFWPGCTYGFCERAPPHVVATGHLAAGATVHSVSARLTALQGGEPNNGYWVTATSAAGTSEGLLQTFATPSGATP
jgi:hypothetical protein